MHKRVLNELSKITKRTAHIAERPTASMQIQMMGKNLINFCSTDFFALSSDPGLKKIYIAAIEELGLNAASGRFGAGYSKYHQRFEERFAKFLGVERSIIFPSRNQAVLSLFSALAKEGDLIISAEHPTTPIADVAALLHAKFKISDFSKLHEIAEDIAKLKGSAQAIIYLEAISPLTGKVAPIKSIADFCLANGTILVVDESLSLGINGSLGRGLAAEHKPYAVIGSFGNSFIGHEGFIASSHPLCELIESRSRALAYEPLVSTPSVLLLDAVLEIIIAGETKRTELSYKSAEFKALPVKFLTTSDVSPILSFQFLDDDTRDAFRSYMTSKGIYLENVPRGTFQRENYLRGYITLGHSKLELDLLKKSLLEFV